MTYLPHREIQQPKRLVLFFGGCAALVGSLMALPDFSNVLLVPVVTVASVLVGYFVYGACLAILLPWVYRPALRFMCLIIFYLNLLFVLLAVVAIFSAPWLVPEATKVEWPLAVASLPMPAASAWAALDVWEDSANVPKAT